jgi:hypothetical protein
MELPPTDFETVNCKTERNPHGSHSQIGRVEPARTDLLDLAGNSEQQYCEPRRRTGLLVSPGFFPHALVRNQHGFDA